MMPLQAAPSKKAKKPPQPITITADELYFSDKTGEMFGKGNVVISQEKSKITADFVRGDHSQTEFWVDGPMRFTEPLTDLRGVKLRYNYGAKYGVIRDINGKCGDDFVSGQKASVENGKITVYQASATGCPAKTTPEYRVTARKVEIWPGDKMIAYDAKIWIKNTVIYSTPRYKRSLKKRDQEDEFPRFGYEDPDGYWISQRFSYAFNDRVTSFVDLKYYTKAGFRPNFGIIDQENDYLMQLVVGRYRDDNSNWITKEPEFRFELYPRPLGKLPLRYQAKVVYGQWTDPNKSSWHQSYSAYLSHNPIYFDKARTWTLNLGTGYEYVRESYDGSSQNVFRFNASIAKALSPRLVAYTAYNYTGNNNSTFAYNRADVAQEGIVGLSWQMHNRTRLSYYMSYDLANSRVYDHYYIIQQNFRCWDSTLTYRGIKKELTWTFTVAKW